METRNAVQCPVCGSIAPVAYDHPEAQIHRCPNCTHAFSDPATLPKHEEYQQDYYDETHRNWFANPNIPLFEWIEGRIPKHALSVIDVGCGRGQFLDYLRGKRPALRLVGVDLSRNENRNQIEFYCGDAIELDLGEFDFVVSLATIEHIPDVSSFTKRLVSLCKSGGTVCVMTLDENSLLYRAGRAGRMLSLPVAFNRLYSAHHLQHFTNKSLLRLLASHGLEPVETLHHSVPLKALDLPVNPVLRPLMLAVVAGLFRIGDVLRMSYLQTIVAKRSTA